MSGEKILIVDDAPLIMDLLKLHLEQESYEVLTAQSVDRALKLLKQGPVDLVMLDIGMPGKSGFDFLQAVSTHHGRPRMPVIVMTGRDALEGLMKGIAVDGFINKPFEMPLVLGKVKQVLSSKKKTVYLADTEWSEQAKAIAKELRDERYQVVFIKDVSTFEAHWAQQPADYIVMAYEQHAVEGKDMIEAIRKYTAVPLIVYTYSGMDFMEKSLEAGASLYIGAPQGPASIVTAIRGFEMK